MASRRHWGHHRLSRRHFHANSEGIKWLVQPPNHLSSTTSTDTWVFKGKNVSEQGTGNQGTYKVSGHDLEIDLNGQKITATLADDKKSFTIDSAPGLAALANGTKYTKVEN